MQNQTSSLVLVDQPSMMFLVKPVIRNIFGASGLNRRRGSRPGCGTSRLAHGVIMVSLRRPATYCSVVGLRPSPGRVTRGTVNTMFSPLSVQGPMARTVEDVALFLDTMAGVCPLDPMTFDAPTESFSDSVQKAVPPRRIAYASTIAGAPVDKETREITAKSMGILNPWA